MASILRILVTLACSALVISSNIDRSLVRWYNHDPKANFYSAGLQYFRTLYIECYDRGQFRDNCSLIISFPDDSDILENEIRCSLPNFTVSNQKKETKAVISALSDYEVLVSRVVPSSNSIRRITLQLLRVEGRNCGITSNEITFTEEAFDNLFILINNYSFGVAYTDRKLCKNFCLQKFANGKPTAKGPFDFRFDSQEAREYSLLCGTNISLAKIGDVMTIEPEERLNATLFFCEELRIEMEKSDTKNVIGRAVSTANGMLSFCKQHRRFKKTLRCSQGSISWWNEFQFPYEVENFLIYSLPEDKYLVMTTESLHSSDIEDKSRYLQFHLTVFDNRGVRHNGIEVFRLKSNDGRFIGTYGYVFENDKGEYCASVFDPDKYKLSSECSSKGRFERDEDW